MRRRDREVTDESSILAIINACDVCRLAFSDAPYPYIVPLNFGFDATPSGYVFYFHCAKEGHKLELMAKNPNVAFEMDCAHELTAAQETCGYGMRYQSVMGTGVLSLVDEADKVHALDRLMHKYAPEHATHYSPQALDAVCVLKLTVTSLSAKARNV